MVRFACPACGAVLNAPESKAGAKVTCPKCKQKLEVPSPAASAPPKTRLGKLLPAVPSEAITNPPGEEAPIQQHASEALSVNCVGCGRAIVVYQHELPMLLECAQCKTSFDVAAEAETPPAPISAEYPDVTNRRLCPFCAEAISPDAVKCRHCGELLDPDMRQAKAMSEGQADGVGLISITCAALALIGTIVGLVFCGYGTLVGVPIALGGLVVSIFATKHKKPAMILNSAALVPPVVLFMISAAIMGFCCAGGSFRDSHQKETPVNEGKQTPKRFPSPDRPFDP